MGIEGVGIGGLGGGRGLVRGGMVAVCQNKNKNKTRTTARYVEMIIARPLSMRLVSKEGEVCHG